MRNDLSVLADRLFSAAAGVWMLVGLAIIALVRSWPLILDKINERRRDSATEKASDWTRLRDEVNRLAERVRVLEEKVEECEKDRDEWRGRAVAAESELIKLEAYHQGLGDAKQTAQLIVSAERESSEKKKGGGE